MLIEAPLHNRNKEKIFGYLKANEQKDQIQRTQLELDPTHKFVIKNPKKFELQFSNMCFSRYHQQKEQFTKIIQKNNFSVIDKIQKIKPLEMVHVIGTLYKQMTLKPSILKSNNKEQSNYVSNGDTLELEDPSGRIRIELLHKATIEGPFFEKLIKTENLLTGSVVLVEGRLKSTNLLEVSRIFYPEPTNLQLAKPRTQEVATLLNNLSLLQEQPKFVAIMSGLNFDLSKSQYEQSKMINFFQGKLTTGSLQQVVHQTVGIIIAGNLVKKDEFGDEILTGPMKKNEGFKNLYQDTEAEFRELDHFLYNLALVTPLYIMPGETDPVSILLPQQPFYKAFFPRCFEQSQNVKLLTNPMEASLGGLNILGTSGQNINDMSKYCKRGDEESRIDLLEQNLLLNNIAPTAPDTLQYYNSQNYFKDPFTIDQWPQIYFAGNQPKFETKLFKEYTRILTVPSYSEEKQICFVSLQNLQCFSITIE